MPRGPPPWMMGLSDLPMTPGAGLGSLMAAPTTTFLSEKVATTMPCVLSFAAEIMKLSGSTIIFDTRQGRGRMSD